MVADTALALRVGEQRKSKTRGARTVVGIRPDGLGIRLQCLLEAMHLSELLGADYAVVWPDPVEGLEHHAVTPARDTFTEAFCRAHVIKRPASGTHADLKAPVADLRALADVAGDTDGWTVRHPHTLTLLPETMRRPANGGFRRLFRSIGFLPHLTAAIAAADRAPLPADAVALHLRAGDIIYGKHRFGARFTRKVISLPIAGRLIEDLTSEGRTVVLFSQDPAATALFRTRPGVVAATDVAPQADVVAQALFEIALMSRCGRIYAGNSVFAQIAALIGDSDLIDPRGVFNTVEQAAVIEATLLAGGQAADYPALQTAFAAWSGAELLYRRRPKRAVPLLETAIRFDPENSCYVLRLAAVLCALDRQRDAEALVATRFGGAGGAAKRRALALSLLHKAGIGGRASILVADRAVLAKAAADQDGPIRKLMDDLARIEAG